jgi:hypothetical protein
LDGKIEQIKQAVVDSGLLVLTLALVTDVSVTLLKVISTDYRMSASGDDKENERQLREYITSHVPKRVDLLEYSAHSVHYLIEELARQGAAMRLLIRDPRVVNDFQRRRIVASIHHIERFAIDAYGADIEIRCYTSQASLRGRMFDDFFVAVGW